MLEKLVTHILKIHFNVKVRLLKTGEVAGILKFGKSKIYWRAFQKKSFYQMHKKLESRMKVMILRDFK